MILNPSAVKTAKFLAYVNAYEAIGFSCKESAWKECAKRAMNGLLEFVGEDSPEWRQVQNAWKSRDYIEVVTLHNEWTSQHLAFPRYSVAQLGVQE